MLQNRSGFYASRGQDVELTRKTQHFIKQYYTISKRYLDSWLATVAMLNDEYSVQFQELCKNVF